jgi:hypothetical protein
MKQAIVFFSSVLFPIGIFLFSPAAVGALGDYESSIDADYRIFAAKPLPTVTLKNYRIHEWARKNTHVREFVSGKGRVFAVSWSGRRIPDLTKLLGGYAGEYETAIRQTVKQKGHRPFGVWRTAHLVVERYGHERWVNGRAYTLDLMPVGVSENEIR